MPKPADPERLRLVSRLSPPGARPEPAAPPRSVRRPSGMPECRWRGRGWPPHDDGRLHRQWKRRGHGGAVAVAAGYDVVLSNSRGPQTLKDLVEQLGPRARAATPAEAAAAGDQRGTPTGAAA